MKCPKIAHLFTVIITSVLALSLERAEAHMQTNQAELETLQHQVDFKINNVSEAFEYVFSNLPDKVKVFPTENYYYYTFSAGGIIYAGNLRLAARDRDKGIVHFAAFAQANVAIPAGEMMYRAMTKSDGVIVKKQGPFSYDITYKDKTVRFELNDVSGFVPPDHIIAKSEEYHGLVWDESGIRFFLFYNREHKIFTYVLDETSAVLDQLVPEKSNKRILIGQRTGFAFYDHHYLDRRVLIGVNSTNTSINNYFDGPGDQLPENHYINDNMRKAIVDSDPEMKGELDRFAYFLSGEGRYLIAPYFQYLETSELEFFEECISDSKTTEASYDSCFVDKFE